jgi:hypothetical protein
MQCHDLEVIFLIFRFQRIREIRSYSGNAFCSIVVSVYQKQEGSDANGFSVRTSVMTPNTNSLLAGYCLQYRLFRSRL